MTWRLRAILIIAAAIALAITGYLVMRRPLSDEEKIVRMMLSVAEAVERKDVRRTMAAVSEDYHDAAGLTRPLLTVLAWRARQIEGKPRVVMGVPEIMLEDGRAAAELEVSVYLVDSSGVPHVLFEGPVSLTLRKEKRGRWRVLDSEGWQQVIDVEQGY